MTRFRGPAPAVLLFSALLAIAAAGCESNVRNLPPESFGAYLETQLLAPWFPAAVDTDAWGFRSAFTRDWQPLVESDRYLVYQARLAWTAAFVGRTRRAHGNALAPAARAGLAALERFHDREHGGYFERVDLEGRPIGDREKAMFVQSFALLALAELAVFAPLGEADRTRALGAARDAFAWIERHGAAPHGGYRSALARDGGARPFDPATVDPPRDGLGVPSAWQDLGTHLHLLEAYAALLRAAPESRDVRARTEALIDLLLGPFWSEPGCLHGSLDSQGRPVPSRISIGHDVEAAAILLEAIDTLGKPRDARVVTAARRLVDYALRWGFDRESGAWATWTPAVLARPRNAAVGSWVPFEAMHALARLHLVGGDAGERYGPALAATWRFVRTRLTDERAPGVWEGLDDHGKVMMRKSGDWIDPYHPARALIVASDALGDHR